MFLLKKNDNHDSIYTSLLSEDPVRPHIPSYRRFAHNRGMFVLVREEDGTVHAASCYVLTGNVPKDEKELFVETNNFNVAVFYTVWALPDSVKGSGRMLINKALNHLHWFAPMCSRAVTLSPKTIMAERFHLSNGATLFRENDSTINYEYII
jgi:hypothetical protein